MSVERLILGNQSPFDPLSPIEESIYAGENLNQRVDLVNSDNTCLHPINCEQHQLLNRQEGLKHVENKRVKGLDRELENDYNLQLEPSVDSDSGGLIQDINVDVEMDILNPDGEKAERDWQSLLTHINLHYYKPDIEALRIALAVANTHQIRHEKPVWLMVIGAAGSGKTALCIGCVSQFKHTKAVDNLTPSTLISGMKRSMGGYSLLHDLGEDNDRSGIITFADLSVLLTKRHEDVQAIFGQLTKIYDGKYDSPTGMKSKDSSWEGKVTCIAAATFMAERMMSLMRATGPRFMQVIWRSGEGEDAIKTAQKARYERGLEEAADEKLKNLAKEFIQGTPVKAVAPLPPEVEDELGLDELATLVALMRTHCERDGGMAGRKISDVDPPEAPTRLSKAMSQVAAGHASLFRREICLEDYKLASRIAWDSIPQNRLMVTRAIPLETPISQADLVKKIKKPRTTVLRVLDELNEIGVVSINQDVAGESKMICLAERYLKLRERAKILMERGDG